MIDGKRLAPYDIDGIVTTDVIPINMLERVDIVTGGASAVYGSDAVAGAVNIVLKKSLRGTRSFNVPTCLRQQSKGASEPR